VFARPFLRRLRGVLEPRGWVALNFFEDAYAARRLERVRALFDVQQCTPVGGNVIVHAQRKRA
jgi:spermidine synthase